MSRITRDLEALISPRKVKGCDVLGFGQIASRLKRHPVPVVAHFRHSLVLTYAFPSEVLSPLLPPGLVLDTYKGFGFVAIAMVQTRALRPAFLPSCFGQSFFLTGYRIFARYRNRDGRLLRGLRILRSDTDRRLMAVFGNLLTHYNYRKADVHLNESNEQLGIHVQTDDRSADLELKARIDGGAAALPSESPFANWHEARRFAGPLPFTFDYEPESHSLILIEGVRRNWHPQPIAVEVTRCSFFDRAPFHQARPLLANAFHVAGIDYRWNRGVVEPLAETNHRTPVFA